MPGYSYDCRIAGLTNPVLVQGVREETGQREWALKSGSQVLRWFGAKKPSEAAVAQRQRRAQYFKYMAVAWDRYAFMERLAYQGILPVPKQISQAMGGHEYVLNRLPDGGYYFLPRSGKTVGGLGIAWESDDERKGNGVEIRKTMPDSHMMYFYYSTYETEEDPSSSWGPNHNLVKTPVKTYKDISGEDLAAVFARQTGIRL